MIAFPRLHLLFGNLKRIYAVVPGGMRGSIWRVFLLMMLLGFAEMGSIMALTFFFTLLNAPQAVTESRLAQKAVTAWPVLKALIADPRLVILWGCMLPIGLIALKNILNALVSWRSAMLGERVAAFVGNTIMERYLHMPYSWHLSGQGGQALLAMQRRFSLGQLLLNLLTAYSNLITVMLLFGGLLAYAPGVTATAVAFMLLTSIFTYKLLKRRIDKAGADAAKAQENEAVASAVAIGGIREIIIYQQQPVFLETIQRNVRAGMRPRSFLGMSPAVPSWTLESGGFFLIWLAVFLLIAVHDAPRETIATTVALLALTAWRVLPSLNRVVGATVTIRGLQAQAVPCLDYLESLEPAPLQRGAAPDDGFSINGEIEFDNVSFRYPGATEDALKHVSCRIPPGATIGLVGRSGSGKSTFINILSGLLEPTEGRLLVNGKVMNASELAAYRRRIGYVPQNPYVLSGTVAQNVAFSEWGQPIDQERVRSACREAAIDFLGPDCMDIHRPLNASGSGLSGGQQQRVSIARALYINPDLLIFDEATSALDQGAEGEVQKAMIKSRGRRMNIIAAHRLETLEICDMVFWLDAGRLLDTGLPKEILQAYCAQMRIS